MITDKDVVKLKNTFVTKDEFKSSATIPIAAVQVDIKNLRSEMNERFTLVDKRFDMVINHLDGIVGRLDGMHQEMIMIIGQLDRHDRWIHQLAEKPKSKLEY